MQLIEGGWANGTPFEFVDNAFACAAPGKTHFFCAHRLDRAFRDTNVLEAKDHAPLPSSGRGSIASSSTKPPGVPLVNIRWVDFVSARVHNYEADPTVGLIADQVSLR